MGLALEYLGSMGTNPLSLYVENRQVVDTAGSTPASTLKAFCVEHDERLHLRVDVVVQGHHIAERAIPKLHVHGNLQRKPGLWTFPVARRGPRGTV
jgi:hypothetical protein